MKQYKKYLLEELVDHKILSTRELESNENAEDDTVVDVDGEMKKVVVEDITDDEFELLLKLRKLDYLRSIKNMVKFFVILTVISLICAFIGFLALPR